MEPRTLGIIEKNSANWAMSIGMVDCFNKLRNNTCEEQTKDYEREVINQSEGIKSNNKDIILQ